MIVMCTVDYFVLKEFILKRLMFCRTKSLEKDTRIYYFFSS